MITLGIPQILLYAVVVVVLIRLLFRLLQLFQGKSLPKLLSTGIICATLIYLACLIPGIIGFLTATNSYILFLLLASGVFYWINSLSFSAGQDVQLTQYRIARTDWLLIGLGVILCAPLLSYLKGLPLAFLDPNPVLAWDVVSYHLPGVIEFYQNKTLWSLSGPYQSYSFGYELIGHFFSQSFYTPWGLVLVHSLALMLLIGVLVSAAKELTLSGEAESNSWIPSAILAVGLWASLAFTSLGAVGKNDIFMGVMVFAPLCYLLILSTQKAVSTTKLQIVILLMGLSLGLSLGVKPSAIAYLPFFWIMTVWVALFQKRSIKQAIYLSTLVIVIALLLGGFWLTRNVLIFGRLSPVLDAGWQASIFANVFNREMYRAVIHNPALLLAGSAWIPALLIAFIRNRHGNNSIAWCLIGGFHFMACLVFLITPFAFQGGGFETRLGMPMLMAAAIIYAATIQLIAHRLSLFKKSWWFVAAVLLILAIPLFWVLKKQNSLAGYEQVFNCPDQQRCQRTQVYAWVQGFSKPLRIYSAGLRPYGLYGSRWENTLFYDLHSSTLVSDSEGKKRVAAVVSHFEPDLILISIAPQANSPSGEKPGVIAWMKARPDLFSEVYSDDIVTGFKVNPGAKRALVQEFSEPYILKMGE